MTELDENISVDSDDDDDSDDLQDGTGYSQGEKRFSSDAERRAHHNALERKRRDHIKECFNHLRDSIPTLQGEKPSRAQILNKAAEYVRVMQQKKQSHWQEIATLKRQIRELEKAEKQLGQDYSPEVNVDSESDEDSSDADKSFHL